MTLGKFDRKVRELSNNRIKVFYGYNDDKPASLYMIYADEEITICGIDKNEVPERTIYDEQGHIVKGGWRRAIKILIGAKLVDKFKAQRIFKTSFDYKEINAMYAITNSISRALQEAENRKINGKYRVDDIMDISKMIRKEKTHAS